MAPRQSNVCTGRRKVTVINMSEKQRYKKWKCEQFVSGVMIIYDGNISFRVNCLQFSEMITILNYTIFFVKSRILLTIEPFHQPVIKFQWKIGFCFAQFLAIISQWQHNCRVMCATFLRSLFQKLNLSTTISVELELCWKTHQWDGPAFCLLSAWTSWEITQLSHGSLGVHWLFCGRKQLYWGQWLLYRGPLNKMCILGGIARYVSI